MSPELVQAVTRFRHALGSGVLRDLIQFGDFPRGACGDTCLLLARWLEEQGFGPWDHVVGWRDGWSHAWLEGDGKGRLAGVIVDVTADQFSDVNVDVIVTDDPSWHRQFTRRTRERAVLSDADTLASAYRTLKTATSGLAKWGH